MPESSWIDASNVGPIMRSRAYARRAEARHLEGWRPDTLSLENYPESRTNNAASQIIPASTSTMPTAAEPQSFTIAI